MIKFLAQLPGSNGANLYGFGLTEANLNRMEFNAEPIFFDFGYADLPTLFGLIIYLEQYATPEEMVINPQGIEEACTPFIDPSRGVTAENLRVFPIAKSVMPKFRQQEYWGFTFPFKIAHDQDQVMIFAGTTELEMQQHMIDQGWIGQETKRTYKGFGKGFGKRKA